MAETVQFKLRRGTTNQFSTFLGGKDEVCTDTTKRTIVIMDGETEGGVPLAREDLQNVTLSTLLEKGVAADDLANVQTSTILRKGIASSDLSNVRKADFMNVGLALDDASNIQHASTTDIGVARFATNSETINSTDPTLMVNPVGLRACLNSITRALPPKFISGMYVEFTSDQEITISTGMCRSLDDQVNITLDAPLPILMQSMQNNKTYHIFIGVNGEGRVSQTYDTSIVPIIFINEGYVHYRRVGSIITDENGKIIEFNRSGNTVYYKNMLDIQTPTLDVEEIELPIPQAVVNTPILYSTGSYSVGLSSSNLLQFTSNNVLSCLNTTGKIYQSGTGTCKVFGYTEQRELD